MEKYNDLVKKMEAHSRTRREECYYRQGVDCDEGSVCNKCGWCPEVEQARKEKIREKLA